MGRAGRAGITVCVSWFPSLHSSTLGPIMVPETPDGKITLLLVPLSPLRTIKPQRNKHFFFLETAEGIQLPVWPQTCSEATPIPIFLQGSIAFCQWLDSNPAFTCRGSGNKVQHGYGMVTEEWQCGSGGGRDSECTGGLAGQNAAARPTTARVSGPSLVSSSTPTKLESTPASQHRNILCAALAHCKIWLR